MPMLKYEEKLLATLESLQIDGIHMEGFIPDQIFYQIKEKTEERINKLEASLNKLNVVEEQEEYENNSEIHSESVSDESASDEPEIEKDEESDELNVESEESTSIHESDWDSEASSQDELMNKPADYVMKLLND